MKQKIAFALMMGIITTGIISFTLITLNVGFGSNFAGIWLRSWAMSYLVVVPIILTVGPLVQKFVNYLFGDALSPNAEN